MTYLPTHADEEDSPDVRELEADVLSGKRCVECLTLFTKRHNHPKTICTRCGRLALEQMGYHPATHAEINREANRALAKQRKQER